MGTKRRRRSDISLVVRKINDGLEFNKMNEQIGRGSLDLVSAGGAWDGACVHAWVGRLMHYAII